MRTEDEIKKRIAVLTRRIDAAHGMGSLHEIAQLETLEWILGESIPNWPRDSDLTKFKNVKWVKPKRTRKKKPARKKKKRSAE